MLLPFIYNDRTTNLNDRRPSGDQMVGSLLGLGLSVHFANKVN